MSGCLEISREWLDEIARRCKEIDEGPAEMIPGEQVLREARQMLAALSAARNRK
jgi:hypothetical protein